jgi:hypothetical protein
VPAISLALPLRWAQAQAQGAPVAATVYPGVTHPHILNTVQGLYDICTMLTGL